MAHRNVATLAWAWNSALLGVDSARTIAARAAMMASPELHGSEELGAEMRLMGHEKVEAAWSGLVAAQRAFGSLLLRAAFGDVGTPADLAFGLGAVADAAMRPTRSKARANARRLSSRVRNRR